MTEATGSRSAVWRSISHLCALVVAGFFIYAAWGKLGPVQARQFAIEIGNYKILDPAYTNIPAVILPWIELYAAVALLFPATRKAGAIVVGGLLLFFIGAVYYAAIVLDLKISCGCTGEGSSTAGWTTIGRNVLLLIATILSVALCRPKPGDASRYPDEAPVMNAAGPRA